MVTLLLVVSGGRAEAAEPLPTNLPAQPGFEQEPNGTPGSATAIGSGQRMRAALSPTGDSDYFRFEARAGERVFTSTMTRAVGDDGATQLALLAGNGTTLEVDLDEGSSGRAASSIAGAVIPSDGTYYLKVIHPTPEGELRLYDLYLQLRPGAPLPEAEPNDFSVEATPLSSGYVSGRQNPSSDRDYFTLSLNAGDTVYLSLDLDPERDGTSFDARLGFGLFHEDKHISVVNNRVASVLPSSPSEDYKVTVSRPGTYYVYVRAVGEDEGGEDSTYRLSASVLPADRPTCRTYTETLSAGTVWDGGETVFPIFVSEADLIKRAAISLDLTHNLPRELAARLRAPSGYEVPLFDDVGSSTPGLHTHMLAHFEPFAAVSAFAPLNPVMVQPEIGDQLAWLVGQQAAGVWNLIIRDESFGETGSVAGIELILCGSSVASPPPLTAGGPLLSRLKISPRRFRAAHSPASVVFRPNGRKTPVGTTVSYHDSEEGATATLAVSRLLPGRKVRGRCVASRRSMAGKPRCRRIRSVGIFTRQDLQGKNRVSFTGWVMGRKLLPGRYRLSVAAASGSGPASNTLAAPFVILP